MTGAPSPGSGERTLDRGSSRVAGVDDPLRSVLNTPEPPPTAPTTESCAVYWLDLGGRITRWSDQCSAVFGLVGPSRPEHFHELFTPEDQEAGVPGLLLRQVANTGAWDGSGMRARQDGTSIQVASSVSRVRTPNGLDIGFMVVTREISNSLAPEKAPVNESAARMASLGRVASDVSHDVQNILTAIRGFAGALERHLPPSGSGHRLWHELLKACDRGTDVTSRLLGTGRPGASEEPTADVHEIVSELEPLLRQVVPARITLSVMVDPSIPPVRLRPSDLELVLLNLVLNARDAIEGHGLISIEARRRVETEGGSRVVLSVADSGNGMTPEVREHCLERAFTTKPRGSGSGLGLALVRTMVDQAGGAIFVESAVGVGTTMTVMLDVSDPVVESEAPAEVLDATSLIVLRTSASGSGRIVASLLRRQGWRVAQVENDDDMQRLSKALPYPPALVVVDDETAASLAQINWSTDLDRDRVPVLFLRNGRGGDLLLRGRYDRELSGPFDPDALVLVVAEMLDATTGLRRHSVH